MEFDKFWENWPKKVAKKKAESAWSKLTLLEKREAMEALPKHIKYWEIKKTHIDFVPYPASWINAARWEDELDMTPAKEKIDKFIFLHHFYFYLSFNLLFLLFSPLLLEKERKERKRETE